MTRDRSVFVGIALVVVVLGATHPLRAAVPPIDRPWTPDDYGAYARMLETNRVSPAALQTPAGAALFRRLVNAENLDEYRNPALRSDMRLLALDAMAKHCASILRTYINRAQNGAPLTREIAELIGFILHNGAATVQISVEVAADVERRKEPGFNEILREFQLGHVELRDRFLHAIKTLESGVYADDDALVLLRAMEKTLPTYMKAFARSDRAQVRSALQSRFSTASHAEEKRALDHMIARLGE